MANLNYALMVLTYLKKMKDNILYGQELWHLTIYHQIHACDDIFCSSPFLSPDQRIL